LPNRDWTPAALAAATQFGSPAKLSVLTKLDGLAGIMRLGRRYDTQRLNRYSEIIRSRVRCPFRRRQRMANEFIYPSSGRREQ
jgi:hypothetical protein